MSTDCVGTFSNTVFLNRQSFPRPGPRSHITYILIYFVTNSTYIFYLTFDFSLGLRPRLVSSMGEHFFMYCGAALAELFGVSGDPSSLNEKYIL